jgi:hypothetical protein
VKRVLLFLLLAAGVWGTAVSCSPAAIEESPNPADSDGGALNTAPETDEGVFPRATLTPPPIGEPVEPESAPEGAEGYPPPPVLSPLPEGYEFPPTIPPLNPYPEANGTLIWVIKPVGEQCAETSTTPDLQTAVADMIAFGIPVVASEITELTVCSACGCPTSAHFRLQIDSGYLGNAAVLGWTAEE